MFVSKTAEFMKEGCFVLNNVIDFNSYYTDKEKTMQPVIVKSELVADYNCYVDQIESIARRYVQRARRLPPRQYLWITVNNDKKVVWPIYENELDYQLCLGCDGKIYAVYEHGIAEEFSLLNKMKIDSTAPDSVVLRDMEKLAELTDRLKDKEFTDKFTTTGQKAIERELGLKPKVDKSLSPTKRKSIFRKMFDITLPFVIVVLIAFIAAALLLAFLYGKYVGW